MRLVFIDTSAFVSILFKEPSHLLVQNILANFELVCASNLLEAETRSAAAREKIDLAALDTALSRVKWVLPDRPISQELRAVSSCGITLKGADSWHLACALHLAGDPSLLPFLTLDRPQAEAAHRLGFNVLPGEWAAFPGTHESPAAYKTSKPRSKKKGKRG